MSDRTPMVPEDLPLKGDGVGGSYAFVERLFVVALLNARTFFLAHPGRWDRMLRFLSAQEIAAVKTIFERRPPTIRAGYANAQDPMPVISVALQGETVSDEFLGDMMGMDEDLPELGRNVTGEIRGEFRRQDIEITIWADHPDVALYLFHWADYALRAHLEWFVRHGLVNPAFTGGGEIAPDARFAPERLFVRQLRWSCAGEAVIVEPIPPPPRSLHLFLENVVVDGLPGGVHVDISAGETSGD